MNRKTEPYRNAHGVELKPGNWFMGADEFGHKEGIIDRVVKSGQVVEINGGPSVVYRSAPGEHAVQSILADNVMQTLGPMVIERDGTVKQNPANGRRPQIQNVSYWKKTIPQLEYIMQDASEAARAMRGHSPEAELKYLDQVNDAATVLFHRRGMPLRRNPLTRVKVKSPAQRGGAAPDARLTKRRKVTQKAPPGFYANPTPRLQSPTQKSQRGHWDAKRERYTDKASIRLQTRRAKTHNLGMPGVWANPVDPVTYDMRGAVSKSKSDGFFQVWRAEGKRATQYLGTFQTKRDALFFAQTYADKNNVSVALVAMK